MRQGSICTTIALSLLILPLLFQHNKLAWAHDPIEKPVAGQKSIWKTTDSLLWQLPINHNMSIKDLVMVMVLLSYFNFKVLA